MLERFFKYNVCSLLLLTYVCIYYVECILERFLYSMYIVYFYLFIAYLFIYLFIFFMLELIVCDPISCIAKNIDT